MQSYRWMPDLLFIIGLRAPALIKPTGICHRSNTDLKTLPTLGKSGMDMLIYKVCVWDPLENMFIFTQYTSFLSVTLAVAIAMRAGVSNYVAVSYIQRCILCVQLHCMLQGLNIQLCTQILSLILLCFYLLCIENRRNIGG